MCGRYSLGGQDMQALQHRYGFALTDVVWQASWNIAPTEKALAVVNAMSGHREAALLRWGLIPHFAKDPKEGARAINARAESLTERPSFREAFQKRRCLIIADGFYEWQAEGKTKHPVYYTLASREPFAFAGLFAWWKSPEGWLASCSIVTTEPNELIAPVHDRMPVILSDEAERIWMDAAIDDPKVLRSVLTPFPAGSMRATRVAQAVNSVRNKGRECLAPVA